jgi:hypothetical protein
VVKLRTRSYANDQWGDALFESTVQRVQNCDEIFLLNNWWGDEDNDGNPIEIETLEEARVHADHHFDANDPADPTLNRLGLV